MVRLDGGIAILLAREKASIDWRQQGASILYLQKARLVLAQTEPTSTAFALAKNSFREVALIPSTVIDLMRQQFASFGFFYDTPTERWMARFETPDLVLLRLMDTEG